MSDNHSTTTRPQAIIDHFRCPEGFLDFGLLGELSARRGFCRFGSDVVCYGRSSTGLLTEAADSALYDVLKDAQVEGSRCLLPLDPTEVVDNLRTERYVRNGNSQSHSRPGREFVRDLYYRIRPLLGTSVRKHLQRFWLRGWDQRSFPSWPVDRTADKLLERFLVLAMKAQGRHRIPFIWFWPDGFSSCAIMTHDVETYVGRNFCSQLMDINDRWTIKSSFQIVPEERYAVSPSYLQAIRDRGFEINVHDLNHDGRLFSGRERFLSRASRINHYAKEYGAKGFRSGALYRNPDWFPALEVSYDMSIPNVAHLDPQAGGCCTVMPYFIGSILEIPLTATQDYSLFHILNDYSLELWRRQIDEIRNAHGLASFIVHPDYIIEKRARDTYERLLAYLAQLRAEESIWIPLPGEVDRWWRQRSQMSLVRLGDTWHVGGPGRERARVAWASLDGDRVVYSVQQNRDTITDPQVLAEQRDMEAAAPPSWCARIPE